LKNKVPTGIELTPLNESFKQDPYPVLKYLREQEPVHHDTQLNRYFVTDYNHVKSILRNAEYFTDPHRANKDSFVRFLLRDEDEQVSMLLLDEPEHKRLRSLVNDIFTPRAVKHWHPRIIEIVEQQLDKITEPEFDLIAEYAAPIPTIVIAEMMGISTDLQADFRRWSAAAVTAAFNFAPTPEEASEGMQAASALEDFFREQIAMRRDKPGPDLISQMLAAQDEGDQLTETEIISQCQLLLIAGNVTTSDLIGNGIKALLQHPDQLAKLRAQPELIQSAVDEILRYDSPVVNSGRITHTDIELGGCPIGKGESLSVSLAAANRDPSVFKNPDVFDIERKGATHQSFGGGRHHCLGSSLAVLEAQEAVLRLLQRFPKLRFSEKPFTYSSIVAFRGMSSCQLRTD